MKAFIITVLVLQTIACIGPVFRLINWNGYHDRLSIYCKNQFLDEIVRKTRHIDISTVGVTVFFYIFGFIVL